MNQTRLFIQVPKRRGPHKLLVHCDHIKKSFFELVWII